MPESPTPIRILVVDDHTLFRRGRTALLAKQGVVVNYTPCFAEA
jgi:DNA-binding NarL/FixJ family response regulator